MKKSTVWNIVSLFVWLAMLCAEALIGLCIYRLNILPTKYLYIFFAILGVVALIMALLMYCPYKERKHKKKRRHIRQIIAYFLAAVIIACCFFGYNAASKVLSFLSSVTDKSDTVAIVDVYVLKENPAKSIADTKDYTFGVTEFYDWENTKRAIVNVEETLKTEIKTKSYDSVFEMVDAMLKGEIDALFLNSSYVDILEENEKYTDYTLLTRVIYEFEVTEDMLSSSLDDEYFENKEQPEPAVIIDESGKIVPFVLYLSGSDTRSKVLYNSRSDVNILAVVNPDTKQILLINTPRDFYLPNPKYNGAMDKLTHCGIYGMSCSMAVLSELYDENIGYYAQINFTGFQTLIDTVGGVTVYSNKAFPILGGEYNIVVGNNHLNGLQALGFARERYSLLGGDYDRGKNQMKIITALIQKMSASTVLTKYSSILNSLSGMFVTNVSQNELSTLVKMQINDMASWEVFSYAVTGKGKRDTTASMPGVRLSVIVPNEDSVAHATQLIDKVMSGEKISADDITLK